ncbi:MAG: hypothetical protein A2X11_05130 [Bacteroidetes bacterium GWE2_42_24]|nr:MAG: hypothetical protein A2X11_05130 [Bacteroidetes bacterium GWE2_42_24]OFY26599.1 MAG: hypothetical protein A2X09_03440 [Bacteroidetes bacterium GWF2_43_11]
MKNFYIILLCLLSCAIIITCSSDKKEKEITNLEELKTAQFAAISGTAVDQIVTARFPETTFSYYNSPIDACVAVQKGIEVVTAYDEPILRHILAQTPGLKILPQMISVDYYGMAVNKNNPQLKRSADSLLDAIQADGRYNKMMERWFSGNSATVEMPPIDWPGNNGVLKFGTSAITEPFAFYGPKQEIKGFDVEFVYLLAKSLDRKLEINDMEFGAIIPSLLSGKSDIIGACITITEERAKSVLFTKPYYKGGIAAVVRDFAPEAKSSRLSNLDDLKQRRIGVLIGSMQDHYVTNNFPEASVIRIDLPTDLATSLKQGQCDAILLNNVAGKFYMKQNHDFAFLQEVVTIDSFAFGFHLNNTRLRDEFNKFLKKIKKDGTYNEICRRWVDDPEAAKMPVIKNAGTKGTLRIGTTGESIPYSFVQDGNVVGLDVEFILRFAADQQLKPNIQIYNFPGLLTSVITGKTDIVGNCIMITEERAKQMAFSDAYFSSESGMIVMKENLADRNDSPKLKNDGSDISTATIGAMTGTTGEMFIRTEYPEAGLKCFDDIMDAVASLQAGKLDYVLTSYTTAIRVAGKNKKLIILPNRLIDEYAAIALPKDQPELLKKVNEILAQFKKDGTLDQIINRWIKPDSAGYQQVAIPKTTKGKPLVVAIAANREPMCFVSDNKITGLDCELIERIAHEIGRPVVYSDMKFSSLIAALGSGKADLVISNMSPTEERKKVVNFSDGYFMNPQVLMTVNTKAAGDGDHAGTSILADIKDSFHNNIIHEKRYLLLWNGLKVTFIISIMAALLGTILGGLICLMRMSKAKGLQLFAKVYIDLLRGIPQVVLLMLMFYVVFAPLDISGITVAIITFAMNFAAYVSEMFRTSIEGVNKGQTEAGIAMGFSKIKTFTYIILPQAIQRVLPVYKGEFIALVKMTAIVGYIAVQDLTKASDIIRSRTFDAFFPLVMIAIMYFALAWVLTYGLERIQIRFTPGRRGR